ncbi:MAG: DPP IV N-terminal domain-containing protein [Abitibacteriaceae bacterium]|nr:DPP IV N-terminal domain-containing protein [Abditibacteriaceae bacterium]MBV9864570.1 DPP IV N-terminal domain-containing protein [Abditibacteriaceae bacterium]
MPTSNLFSLMIALSTLLLGTIPLLAQGTRADYERASNLRKTTQNKVFKARVEAHWLPGNTRFWYRNDLPNGTREFILVDAIKGSRQPAFDHARLATALAKLINQPITANQLPINKISLSDDSSVLFFSSNGKWWQCNLKSYAVRAAPEHHELLSSLPASVSPHPSTRTGPETSLNFINSTKADIDIYWINPDGQHQHYATVHPGDHYEQHTFAGHVWLVTDHASKTLAVFEATEDGDDAVIDEAQPKVPQEKPTSAKRPNRDESPDGHWLAFIKDNNASLRDLQTGQESALSHDGKATDAYEGQFFWSPDSKKLVALRTQPGDDRKVYLIESSPKDQLQPKLQSYDYLKPGDRIPITKPQLFDVQTHKQIAISDKLFPNPWSISELHWTPDSSRFTFLYNQRGHQVLRIIAVDAQSGETRAIVDEQSRTFIDYAGKQFTHYLDKTHEIIWMSERDGWNHLYLYDAATGRVKNQVTKGEWVVRGVDRVDEAHRQIWFRAGGIRAEQDPYYIHYCRVNFDGTGLVDLTPANGTHTISFAPDQQFYIDTWSRIDMPPVTELRRSADGSLVCALERADNSELLKTGWQAPEPFVAKGRDGTTDIYGVIFRPTNFDPQRKYPVVENIYAGPQDSFVPKAFAAFHGSQEIAELGFIVVQIDGMGTSNRSKKFHDVCWKNLGDAGFPDRILWIKAAAAKYPYLDTSRVGIYGTSAGGQSALRALLAFHDFYQVAVADCGCHDNRMDKIWWNELWMGWPLGPHYEEQSNVTQAHNLQGNLLLLVGELDKNVDPASTMQVVNALIKADKDFDLLVVPGAGHGVAGSPYGKRRLEDFLVRHLLGLEPRS